MSDLRSDWHAQEGAWFDPTFQLRLALILTELETAKCLQVWKDRSLQPLHSASNKIDDLLRIFPKMKHP